jgi:hypothetical protein
MRTAQALIFYHTLPHEDKKILFVQFNTKTIAANMYSNNESGGNALSSYTINLSVVYLTTHLDPHVIQRQMTG